MEAALTEILSTAIRSFVNNDLQLAARVEPLEELIDNLCDEMKLHHVDRLQKGLCTLGQGFVFNDLLTNYERVADHCSNIAVALIELESDSFDTHEYLNSLKELKSDMYERYYEEYRRDLSIINPNGRGVPAVFSGEGHAQYADRTICAQPQRQDAPWKCVFRAAGLALRAKPERADAAAH